MNLDLEDEIEFESEKITECELCGSPCDFIPFACRCEDGKLAEIRGCCQKCHDTWCLCKCPRITN